MKLYLNSNTSTSMPFRARQRLIQAFSGLEVWEVTLRCGKTVYAAYKKHRFFGLELLIPDSWCENIGLMSQYTQYLKYGPLDIVKQS